MNISNIQIIKLHKTFGYISLIIMGIHLGLNSSTILAKIKINKILLYIIEILITIYGFYSFIKLDIIKHILGIYGFNFMGGNIVVNILRYLCIVLMIGIITNCIKKWRNKNEE